MDGPASNNAEALARDSGDETLAQKGDRRLLKLRRFAADHALQILPCPMIQNYLDCERYDNPVIKTKKNIRFREPDEFVLSEIHRHRVPGCMEYYRELWGFLPQGFVYAGPRREVIFQGKDVRAAIVTCGGLCPGLNSVVLELASCLEQVYSVQKVFGIRYGYRGFYDFDWMQLDRRQLEDIHKLGGTILGTARGGFDVPKIVGALEEKKVDMVFVIGGDGSQRAALDLHDEFERRRLKISVIGIPKTIDNDIGLLDKSFGFDTACDEAAHVLERAHTEVCSAWNGIAIVKLMGRSSGFVAAQASMASGCVDVCLIPEISFALEGEHGLLQYVRNTVERTGKCVIAMAEAAGAENLPETGKTDLGGNAKLPNVGEWLRGEVEAYLKRTNFPGKVFYIDPSYLIRSVAPSPSDRLYCSMLAHMAVHGAMAGYTGCIVGLVHNSYVYLPIAAVAAETRRVKIDGNLWQQVLMATGQSHFE